MPTAHHQADRQSWTTGSWRTLWRLQNEKTQVTALGNCFTRQNLFSLWQIVQTEEEDLFRMSEKKLEL